MQNLTVSFLLQAGSLKDSTAKSYSDQSSSATAEVALSLLIIFALFYLAIFSIRTTVKTVPTMRGGRGRFFSHT